MEREPSWTRSRSSARYLVCEDERERILDAVVDDPAGIDLEDARQRQVRPLEGIPTPERARCTQAQASARRFGLRGSPDRRPPKIP